MTEDRPRGGTILVVNDDPALRRALACVLGRAGWRVLEAGDGREALARVAEQMPALILLDLHMPRMNGWECARRLRERHGAGLPIVIHSGEDGRRAAEELGAVGLLEKPARPDRVLRAVERALARS